MRAPRSMEARFSPASPSRSGTGSSARASGRRREGRSMKIIWDRIHAWLQEHAPLVLDSLNPGASAEQIRAVETELNVTFPDDVRETYRLHNGQTSVDVDPPSFL